RRPGLVASSLISGEHDHGKMEIARTGRSLSDLADGPAIQRDAFHTKALGMRQHAIFGAGHGVLAYEENPVIQSILKIIVRRCGTALDQLRGWIDVGNGKAATAIVAIPDDHLSGARFEQALDRRIELTHQQ